MHDPGTLWAPALVCTPRTALLGGPHAATPSYKQQEHWAAFPEHSTSGCVGSCCCAMAALVPSWWRPRITGPLSLRMAQCRTPLPAPSLPGCPQSPFGAVCIASSWLCLLLPRADRQEVAGSSVQLLQPALALLKLSGFLLLSLTPALRHLCPFGPLNWVFVEPIRCLASPLNNLLNAEPG